VISKVIIVSAVSSSNIKVRCLQQVTGDDGDEQGDHGDHVTHWWRHRRVILLRASILVIVDLAICRVNMIRPTGRLFHFRPVALVGITVAFVALLVTITIRIASKWSTHRWADIATTCCDPFSWTRIKKYLTKLTERLLRSSTVPLLICWNGQTIWLTFYLYVFGSQWGHYSCEPGAHPWCNRKLGKPL